MGRAIEVNLLNIYKESQITYNEVVMGRPRTVTDEQVFQAVAEVVTEEGPSGLTFAAVADRVGLTGPALAQRFGSKRGLLVAFARAGGVEPVFQRARDETGDPLMAISTALSSMISGISTRQALANNLAFLHMDLTDEELGRPAIEQSRSIRRHLAALVEEAVSQGSIRDVDADELAETIYTIYNGALISWAIDGRGKLAKWLTQRIERVIAPYLVDS
jgi:AcrR family transcriptional regulator